METENKQSTFAKPWVKSITGISVIILALGGFVYYINTIGKIHIDNSMITAPIINLSPTTGGLLQEIYVNVGDTVSPNTLVAKVGDEIISAKVAGTIVSVNHQEGQMFAPGSAVVTMINTKEERVIGSIDENKGLKDIIVGDKATFTVDAFPGKEYSGIVDEVSPISNQSNVVFSISDKRETRQFNIKVSYNLADYPELKEGMSAKLTIYVK